MTASGETRHESEALDRGALAAVHAAADPATAARLGLALRPAADGVASLAPGLPASAIVVNRAFGFGRERPVAPGTIAEVAALFREAGVARFFVQLDPAGATPALEAACRAEGLEPARAWQKFLRPRGAPLAETAPIEIREARPEDGPAVARIACAAFDLGEAAEPWIARLPGRPGFRFFVAIIEGTVAGIGGLHVAGEAGRCDWGATDPAFRRRGVQRALLVHRCRVADALGLARLHTETGAPAPGDPQHSYSNILRCGFRETYLRPNWAPPRA